MGIVRYMTVSLLFLILAFICFVCGAFNVVLGRINIVSLGLSFWALAVLIGGERLFMH